MNMYTQGASVVLPIKAFLAACRATCQDKTSSAHADLGLLCLAGKSSYASQAASLADFATLLQERPWGSASALDLGDEGFQAGLVLGEAVDALLQLVHRHLVAAVHVPEAAVMSMRAWPLAPMLGHSMRGSGSWLASSSPSSAGEMVMLSHLPPGRMC